MKVWKFEIKLDDEVPHTAHASNLIEIYDLSFINQHDRFTFPKKNKHFGASVQNRIQYIFQISSFNQSTSVFLHTSDSQQLRLNDQCRRSRSSITPSHRNSTHIEDVSRVCEMWSQWHGGTSRPRVIYSSIHIISPLSASMLHLNACASVCRTCIRAELWLGLYTQCIKAHIAASLWSFLLNHGPWLWWRGGQLAREGRGNECGRLALLFSSSSRCAFRSFFAEMKTFKSPYESLTSHRP